MPDRRHVMRNERLAGLQTDAFSGCASWGTGLLSVVWLGRPGRQTQLFFVVFFVLTFAKLKQEVLNLRGSNSCRMTEVEWTDEMQHGNPETCWIRISQLRTEIPVLVYS